jgi:hypothetical protein
MLHPIDGLAVEAFLNGEMRYGHCRRCAMPMFFAGRNPDDVAGPDVLDRAALALNPAASGGDD